MGKIKKLKGWNYDLFITPDEKLLTLGSRNTAYVYDLDTKEIVFKAKTVSNLAYAVISSDKKLLAAKNTSGLLAIISMETGEEICRNKMEKTEGWEMTFSKDDQAVIDFDWDGRTMLLTLENQCTILDGPASKKKENSSPFVYMKYDPYTKQIYKFMEDHPDYNGNFVVASPADKDNISYNILRRISGEFPDNLRKVNFCKEHIYYSAGLDLIMCDRQFKQVDKIRLPLENFVEEGIQGGQTIVSPCEKYAFFRPLSMGCSTYLFDLRTKELVRKFDYPFVSGFTMIKGDTEFLVSTWEGTYIGEL